MFFLSDNGYLLGEHRRTTKKGEAYDEPNCVPFMARWPGVVGRTERRHPSIDLSATICAIADHASRARAGSTWPRALTSGTPVRDVAYIEPPGGGWDALRSGTQKYVEYGNGSRATTCRDWWG